MDVADPAGSEASPPLAEARAASSNDPHGSIHAPPPPPSPTDDTALPRQYRGTTRHTYREAATGNATLPDWSRFNIQMSLRNLRSFNATVVQKELRKLHIRWWHASAKKMQKLLQHAGVPKETIDKVKDIVDACRICRMWASPDPKAATSTTLAEYFNEIVQHDLLIVESKDWMHLIDRCT